MKIVVCHCNKRGCVLLYIVTSEKTVHEKKDTGETGKMNIVIVGDGKVGAALTEHLSHEGHDVVVIDKDPRVVEEMVNAYDVLGLCGNGASYDVQMEAGVDKARLLIAATSSDELNIFCCLVAKKIGAHQRLPVYETLNMPSSYISLKKNWD